MKKSNAVAKETALGAALRDAGIVTPAMRLSALVADVLREHPRHLANAVAAASKAIGADLELARELTKDVWHDLVIELVRKVAREEHAAKLKDARSLKPIVSEAPPAPAPNSPVHVTTDGVKAVQFDRDRGNPTPDFPVHEAPDATPRDQSSCDGKPPSSVHCQHAAPKSGHMANDGGNPSAPPAWKAAAAQRIENARLEGMLKHHILGNKPLGLYTPIEARAAASAGISNAFIISRFITELTSGNIPKDKPIYLYRTPEETLRVWEYVMAQGAK